MSDVTLILVFVIACVVVSAMIKAFKAIDSDGAIWAVARKAIAARIMGWFQRPVSGPSHGQEQDQLSATETVIHLPDYLKELAEADRRDREKAIQKVQECDQRGAN